LKDYDIKLHFGKDTISYVKEGVYKQTAFKQEKGTKLVSNFNQLELLKVKHTQESDFKSEWDKFKMLPNMNNIDEAKRSKIYSVLETYKDYMVTKPGKCKLFTYKFQVEIDKPIIGYSRPIPFTVRSEVRNQIKQMSKDDILEVSTSPILNPLTIVHRERKKVRICIDARKVNQCTIPDRERVPPIQEILQKFEGTIYMSSLDLNSAYLQIELDKDSRKYTAFLFETTVYQYKGVPYGFRNSLSAFIREMKLTLGVETEEYVVFYVDDILIYSKSFEEHVIHLDTAIKKLTKAGFTLNIGKCQFCREEIKFLGHIINKSGVSTDSEKVEAIRHNPVPQNRKQLRQFLGICSFHSRFIVGYANYAAPCIRY
jgi:hypothetical protein